MTTSPATPPPSLSCPLWCVTHVPEDVSGTPGGAHQSVVWATDKHRVDVWEEGEDGPRVCLQDDLDATDLGNLTPAEALELAGVLTRAARAATETPESRASREAWMSAVAERRDQAKAARREAFLQEWRAEARP